MNIHGFQDYNNVYENSIFSTEGDDLLEFQKIAADFDVEYNSRTVDSIVMLSQLLLSSTENVRDFPNWLIDDTNILVNLGNYLNNVDHPLFIENSLTTIQIILKRSEYAQEKFIQLNPGPLLIELAKKIQIAGKRIIFQILKIICSTSIGVDYVTKSCIINYIINSIKELFDLLAKDRRENSPLIDPALDLLQVLIEIVKNPPKEIEGNYNLIIEISNICFESDHYRNFVKSGIQLLFYFSNSLNNNPALQNNEDIRQKIYNIGLFTKIMNFLSDNTIRQNFIYCIHFISFFLQHEDTIFVTNIAQVLFENGVISKIIDLFLEINNDDGLKSDDELTKAILNLFINISMLYSDFIDPFINNPNFFPVLKKLIGTGSREIIKSSMWLVWDMLYIGMREQKRKIIESGIFDFLEDSIYIEDRDFLINIVINSCRRMVKSFRINGIEQTEPFAEIVIKIRCIIRDLVSQDDVKVHDAAIAFLHEYFPEYSFNEE